MNLEELEPILFQLTKEQADQVKEIEIDEPIIAFSFEQVNSLTKQLNLNDKIQLFTALFKDVNEFVDLSSLAEQKPKNKLDSKLPEEIDYHQNYLEGSGDVMASEELTDELMEKYGF